MKGSKCTGGPEGGGGVSEETRNATCPRCSGSHLDREDEVTTVVFRRIEDITDVGSIYGLRARSRQPDRPTGMSGRKGAAIRCDDCGWRVEVTTGDKFQDPDYQELLRRLVDED